MMFGDTDIISYAVHKLIEKCFNSNNLSYMYLLIILLCIILDTICVFIILFVIGLYNNLKLLPLLNYPILFSLLSGILLYLSFEYYDILKYIKIKKYIPNNEEISSEENIHSDEPIELTTKTDCFNTLNKVKMIEEGFLSGILNSHKIIAVYGNGEVAKVVLLKH